MAIVTYSIMFLLCVIGSFRGSQIWYGTPTVGEVLEWETSLAQPLTRHGVEEDGPAGTAVAGTRPDKVKCQ